VNVGELQRKLSLKAERAPKHRFADLYNLLYDKTWLRLAHDAVAQNAGKMTAGCDGMDMKAFDEHLEANLQELARELKTETFEPYPVRRVYIPKPGGKVRPLGILTIRDRIVQEAVRRVLEPIYEAEFSQYSFGFRPNRCTMDAIRCITWTTQEHKKYFWVIEGDIASCFDTIQQKRLYKLLQRRIKDRRLLALIWQFLRAGVMERQLFQETKRGVPQGGILSPVLSNIYLAELDRYMARYTLSTKEKAARRRRGQANFVYCRYADDFVVLCNGRKGDAEAVREELTQFLKGRLKLTLAMEKTKITHLNDGFTFLGFRIHRTRGHQGMTTKVLIPTEAVEAVRVKITHITHPTSHRESVKTKILALNRIISGWCRYYQYTSQASTVFNRIQHRTFQKLACWLGRKFRIRRSGVMRRYRCGNTFATGQCRLVQAGTDFPTQIYRKRFLKPNPYTTQERMVREALPHHTYWSGHEARPGMADLRLQVLTRDGNRCQYCGVPLTPDTAQVDHIRPVRRFKRPVDANHLANLQTLCIPCHRTKTQLDRQGESRVR
jgi:RNA-directed DNA polymerase